VLEALDVIFHILHLSIILINLTFWMSFRTLKIAQATVSLTLVSWLGFGFFYGFGYCFLTDWQWQVKEKLGQTNLPASYIKYVLDLITGMNLNPELVDRMALVGLSFSVLGCLIQTIRKIRKEN
jgi:hypothetical protein